LLGVDPDNFTNSPFAGAIWESFVFAELRKYQQLYQPRASVFFYRDQQNREVDFVWSRAGHLVLMEAKWAEHVRRPDASVMETVTNVFAASTSHAYQITKALLICRTPNHFALTETLQAVNGFRLRDVVAQL
jgi:predicted AAA+ superfamily ATPase